MDKHENNDNTGESNDDESGTCELTIIKKI